MIWLNVIKNKKEKNETKSFIYQQISGDYR